MRKDIVNFMQEKRDYQRTILKDRYEYHKKVLHVAFPIVLVEKILMEKKERIFANKYDLGKSEFDVLITLLCSCESLTPTTLYENMIFSSGGMTKLLKKLESKKYIERIPSETDKRSILVKLTEEGYKITLEAYEEMLESIHDDLDVLDDKEVEILDKALTKLLGKLSS